MKLVPITALLVTALALAGCTGGNTTTTTTSTPTTTTQASTSTTTTSTPVSTTPMAMTLHADLLGDGSTFVAPVMDKWRTAFTAANSGVTISYGGGGSGQGRTHITQKVVDFAGSDAPMSDAEIANATDILHLPAAVGGVAIAYNLDGITQPVKFDGDTLAKIFLGTITSWNDPALVALNTGITLPAHDIQVVHRSDKSGTTATFTDYLSKVSPAWKSGPGTSSLPTWPTGKGASGNNGVGAAVQQTPDAIAYIGSEWTNISKIQTGLVKNKAGNFVGPTTSAASAAVDAGLAAGAFDERLRGSVTDQAGANSYPITAVSWVLVHQNQGDLAKGQALAAFAWYILHDGQGLNEGLNYAKVPSSLVSKAEVFVNSMNASGTKLR